MKGFGNSLNFSLLQANFFLLGKPQSTKKSEKSMKVSNFIDMINVVGRFFQRKLSFRKEKYGTCKSGEN